MTTHLQTAVLTAVLVVGTLPPAAPAAERSGPEILRDMVDANRLWLLSPPDSVQAYAYTFHRHGADPLSCAVPDAGRARGAERQGITYHSLVHEVARHPEDIRVTGIEETDGRLRLTLAFKPFKGGCGNGIRNSWYGYFNLGGEAGLLVLDAERLTPVSSIIGDLEETFQEYVELGPGRYAPLAITLQNGADMRFEWTFQVHRPGLWLLDRSRYRDQDVAWIDAVAVNQQPATPLFRMTVEIEREQRIHTGTKRAGAFLEANRSWLLPSLEARRGLVYDYRQAAPYHERVIFDPEGNLMVQLEASQDSPDRPTRQRLWLADGRRIDADFDDPFVEISPGAPSPAGLLADRMVQHLAMGLGLDCALTRWARSPDACWTEILPGDENADTYTLVLHWKDDARLFTGTMLAFTSWAYMHDVRYQRSEILCDAATHRPLEEKDFAGDALKGHYRFADYLDGGVPGRIEAIVPHEEDGHDRSLEVTAQFQALPEGIWLLHDVHSAFRGSSEGSTGTVTLHPPGPDLYRPINRLMDRYHATEQILADLQASPEGTNRLTNLVIGSPVPFALRPAWTDEARDASNPRRDEANPRPALIGIHQAEVVRGADGTLRIVLDGIAQCDGKAYTTTWTAAVTTSSGESHSAAVETEVKSEGRPAAFRVEFTLPGVPDVEPLAELRVAANVTRVSGFYHGHGMWLRMQ